MVDQSCTRVRTPVRMVPVVVIVAIATDGARGASMRRAAMAWTFGMGRNEYRTMMRRVKMRRALFWLGFLRNFRCAAVGMRECMQARAGAARNDTF